MHSLRIFRFVRWLLFMWSVGLLTLQAGPYAASSNDSGNAYDAPIAGFVGPDGEGKANIQSGIDLETEQPVYINTNNYVNPVFKGWATTVVDYSPASNVDSQWRNASQALGAVTGDYTHVVSLGDLTAAQIASGAKPGSITLGFSQAICNGIGTDFAVFENALVSSGGAGVAGQTFAELAFVEVSTDGLNFARLPSVSLTPNAVGQYGTVDPTNIYNLAGKSVNNDGDSWGTAFDLDSLVNDSLVKLGLVNLDEINYIRIVDIPGTGTYLDSLGNPIYDATVTTGSGGFDLEAIGAINVVPEPSVMALLIVGLGSLCWRRRRVEEVS